MAKEFIPIFDRVVIKRLDSSLQRKADKGGIIVPDTIKNKYQSSEGTLVQCGEDCHPDVLKLLGKQVLFAKFSGDEIVVNGEEFVLATDRDIFGQIT